MKKIQTKSDKLAFGNTRFLTLNDHIKFESLTFQVNPWDVSKVFDFLINFNKVFGYT